MENCQRLLDTIRKIEYIESTGKREYNRNRRYRQEQVRGGMINE